MSIPQGRLRKFSLNEVTGWNISKEFELTVALIGVDFAFFGDCSSEDDLLGMFIATRIATLKIEGFFDEAFDLCVLGWIVVDTVKRVAHTDGKVLGVFELNIVRAGSFNSSFAESNLNTAVSVCDASSITTINVRVDKVFFAGHWIKSGFFAETLVEVVIDSEALGFVFDLTDVYFVV